MRDEAKIVINGKHWKIKLVPAKDLPSDADGTCSYPPGRFPSLEVNKNLTEKQIMITLIHELLHASCEVLAEESVIAISEAVAKGMWAMNYRRVCPKPRTQR